MLISTTGDTHNCLFIKLGVRIKTFPAKRKSYPLTTHTFYPLVLVRHVTETDNLHTQVTQHKYTTNTRKTTHKQSRQTENNQSCETLGLFILLSAEIWITVMKND